MLRFRNQKGSVALIIPCLILIVIVGIGAFAVDTNHNVTVRSEMQNATDAGALAGARDLLEDSTQNRAIDTALDVAQDNTADGKPVSNATPGTTVTPTTTSLDPTTNSMTCTVDAEKTINNVFAKIFGHGTDKVNTHSVAICYRSITGIAPNTGFPLIVSADTTQGNPKPLWKMKVGDKFDIYINSQQWKNGAWTSFKMKNTNADWLKNAMQMGLGLKPMESGVFTGIDVGEKASMGNGVQAQKKLADSEELNALTRDGAEFVIPVMTGDPPYNQDRQVVGFITFKAKGVEINRSGGEVEVIHAELVKGITKGEGGIPAVSAGNINNSMQELSPGTVQLVQ